jgi:DNA modification methylase
MDKPPTSYRWKRQPPLKVLTTTLWEFPDQNYLAKDGSAEQGSRDYAGATPSWVIWQLLTRYTREGDRVLDPMCGSGTTLDVCKDLGREGLGYDLAPAHPQVRPADARALPLGDVSVDFVFIDPPYSTHVDYSDDPRCIGKLDAGGPDQGRAYYEALEKVIKEAQRVLRYKRYLALFVSDSWRRKRKDDAGGAAGGLFMPIGFELFSILRRYLIPVDIISVVRHNRNLRKVDFHQTAADRNFFLRGFGYLFVMRKEKPPKGP